MEPVRNAKGVDTWITGKLVVKVATQPTRPSYLTLCCQLRYAVLGVVMDNRQQGQTLFYQVNLGDTRDNTGCPGHGNSCDMVPLRWYASSNPYGATDSPANYNATCLKMSPSSPGSVNTPTLYRLDVLPKLLQALAQGPATLSKDAEEWTVGSCYLGLGMQGSVTQSLFVESLDILEEA